MAKTKQKELWLARDKEKLNNHIWFYLGEKPEYGKYTDHWIGDCSGGLDVSVFNMLFTIKLRKGQRIRVIQTKTGLRIDKKGKQ